MKVSLKEYFEVQLRAITKAVDVANAAMDRRLEGMNEFRDSLKDQTGTFARKDETDRIIEDIKADVEMLREWKSNMQGRSSVAIVLAAISIIIALITLLFNIY